MAKVIQSLYVRIKRFLNEEVTRKAVVIPYLLIGLLWFLEGEANDQARASDLRTQQVLIAHETYRNNVHEHDAAIIIRNTCIEMIHNRNNTIENWHALYAFIATLGERGAAYAAELQKDFDGRNPPKSIEVDCRKFPEPEPVQVPQILIEEGIIDGP